MISPSGVPTLMMNSGIWSLSRLGRANPGNVRAGCRRYLRTLVQLTAREEDSFSTAAAFAILLAHGATPRLRRECEPERERELTTGNERHRTCVGERRGGFVERSGVSMQRIGGRETPGAGGKDEPERAVGARRCGRELRAAGIERENRDSAQRRAAGEIVHFAADGRASRQREVHGRRVGSCRKNDASERRR